MNAEQLRQRKRIREALLDAGASIKNDEHGFEGVELDEGHKALETLSYLLGKISTSEKDYDVATKLFFRGIGRAKVPAMAQTLLENRLHMSSLVVERTLPAIEYVFAKAVVEVPFALRVFHRAYHAPRPDVLRMASVAQSASR